LEVGTKIPERFTGALEKGIQIWLGLLEEAEAKIAKDIAE